MTAKGIRDVNQGAAADAIEAAVSVVLDQGLRTEDISSLGNQTVDTKSMGDAVVSALVKG